MKFRGETRKTNYNCTLILAIATLLININPSTAQDPLLTDPARPTTDEEKVFSATSTWKRAAKIRTYRGHRTGVDSLVFTVDGKVLFSGGSENDGSVRAWSIEKGKELEDLRAQQTNVLSLSMTPNGKTLVSSGKDAIIHIWDLTRKRDDDEDDYILEEFDISFLEHSYEVLSTVISPDGSVLVSGALDGIRVWTIAPSRPLYKLAEIGNPVYALAFNPNGYVVASGNDEGRVQFWNVREGNFISEFFPHQEPITKLLFTPDGKTLITASNDRTLKIWDLETGQLLHTLTGHTDTVRAIALNPDGRTLASGSNDGIFIWDIESGEAITKIRAHRDWVTSLAFSNDGHFLASGGLDSIVYVWADASVQKNYEPIDNAEDVDEEDEVERQEELDRREQEVEREQEKKDEQEE
jgi:COMPASS component SWD3